MKKILTIAVYILLAVTFLQAQRQQHYGDTIIPETCTEYLFLVPWWGEHWINADSTTMVYEAVRDSVYYNSEEDHGHILIGDWVEHNVTHQIILWDNGNYHRGEHLHLFENSQLIKITGVAIAGKLELQIGRANCDTVAPYPDSAEYLTCYLKGEAGYPVRQQITPWTFGDSCRYLRFETKGQTGARWCCEVKTRDTLYLPVYEHFFDEPVYTDDGFFLGSTNFSRQVDNGCTRACIYDFEGGGCGLDTCPRLYTSYYDRGARNINDTNIGWGLIMGWNRAPLIFAIYEPCDCPGAMNLRVAGIHGDTAHIAWTPSSYVSRWEVSYGQEGTPLSGYTTVWTDTNTFSFVIPDSNRYSVRVRAQCGGDSAIYGDWSRSLLVEHAVNGTDSNTVSIRNANLDNAIMLLPNPASKQVTVSAALSLLHVEVYDMAGRLVEAHQPSGTTLQIDLKAYPTGTYLVKVTTTNGTTTKKLVVK